MSELFSKIIDKLALWGLTTPITFLLGVACAKLASLVGRLVPARLLLGSRDADELVLTIGVPLGIIPGVNELSRTEGMPIFGYGPLIAYSQLNKLFHSAFPKQPALEIIPSNMFPSNNYRKDIISIGWPSGNQVTEKFFEQLSLPYVWNKRTIVDAKAKEPLFERVIEGGSVVKDYGMLVRTPNPFDPERSLTVLAGSDTFGVKAAAEFLCLKNLPILMRMNYLSIPWLIAFFDVLMPNRKNRRYFQVIVSTQVHELETSVPKLERIVFFDDDSEILIN